MSGGRVCLLLLLVLQGLHHCVPEDTGQEDLPGHLQPLGAHMPPEQVRRLSHLPSPREFQEKFVAPKTPVIFDGAMRNSPTCVNWQDDEYIREHFGKSEVGIEHGKKENRLDPRYLLTINEFLDTYKEADIYLVDSLTPEMYQEWLVPRPFTCGGFREHFLYVYMWFSSGGTRSILHTDTSENLHCVVSGRKEFLLMEPQYTTLIGPEHAQQSYYDMDVERVNMTRYPELSKIPWYQAVLNAGDCLYLPYQWIHHAIVNTTGRNLAVNIWWIPFEFDEGDCPPAETQLPEYFPLADVQLAPDMMIVDVLTRMARPDGSVHADEVFAKAGREMNIFDPHHVEQMFELLEPGCNGVITDYKAIDRSRISLAFDYIQDLEPEMPPEGEPQQYEIHDPHNEFGGQDQKDEL